jgi:starch synthase
MYVTMVSAECAPAAKAGGLGDFVHGLGRELAQRGHEVEVILPKYDVLRYERIDGRRVVMRDLRVPFHAEWLSCEVEEGTVDGLRCRFIDPHSPHGLFNRGTIYGEGDDPARFAFFSRAVLELLLKSDRQPDVIHCHDWQTGLVPVLLWEMYQGLGLTHPRVCYTLHNLGYQGVTDPAVIQQVGLDPRRLMTADRLAHSEGPGAVNLMQGGIVYANFVTTVSPRYAWEIQNTEQGMGLQGVLRTHGGKFGGVLNGIDCETWNPELDPLIAHHYGPDSLPGKAANKSALRRRLGLPEAPRPVVAVVSRLDRQKGVDLIRHAVHRALGQGCQMVLLGSAQEPAIDAMFRDLKGGLAGNPDASLTLGYDEELAHQIYAGADILVIPSVYEPCGLTQMIAMKYGAVPVVRRVGGLADTVFDANYSDRPFGERNGYLFDDFTPEALDSALDRAVGLWFQYPQYFRELRLNGMRADNSWNHPGRQYLEIYQHMRG